MFRPLPKVKRGNYGFSTEQKEEEQPYINLHDHSITHLVEEVRKKVGYSEEVVKNVVRLMFNALYEDLVKTSHVYLPNLGHLYVRKPKVDVKKHWNYKTKSVTYSAMKFHVKYKETTDLTREINKADRKVVGMTYVQFKEFMAKEKMAFTKDKVLKRKQDLKQNEEVINAEEV